MTTKVVNLKDRTNGESVDLVPEMVQMHLVGAEGFWGARLFPAS